MKLFQAATVHRVLLTLVISLLIYMGYLVLKVFLAPAVWAAILAYVTWPAYIRLRVLLKDGPNSSATLMTLALTVMLVVPMLWIFFVLQEEVAIIYQKIVDSFIHGKVVLPSFIRNLPNIGKFLQSTLDRFSSDPDALKMQWLQWSQYGVSAAGELASSVSRNLAKMGITLFTLFFFYRDGERIIQQVRQALGMLIGNKAHNYIHAAGDMTRAVVNGIVLTALAQGFLAGVGYAVAGMENPVFLAAITTLIAMLPFGTPLAWGAVAIWLFMHGHTVEAIGLAIWGAAVVSTVDNIIRPLVISSATEIPFLLVMFGVLGGLSAFGMVGLFLGPVILAVLMAVWRQWLASEAHNV